MKIYIFILILILLTTITFAQSQHFFTFTGLLKASSGNILISLYNDSLCTNLLQENLFMDAVDSDGFFAVQVSLTANYGDDIFRLIKRNGASVSTCKRVNNFYGIVGINAMNTSQLNQTYATNLNVPQKRGDGNYLFNDSSIMYFNDTKVNNTYPYALNRTDELFAVFYARNVINSAILNNITNLNATINSLFYPASLQLNLTQLNNSFLQISNMSIFYTRNQIDSSILGNASVTNLTNVALTNQTNNFTQGQTITGQSNFTNNVTIFNNLTLAGLPCPVNNVITSNSLGNLYCTLVTSGDNLTRVAFVNITNNFTQPQVFSLGLNGTNIYMTNWSNVTIYPNQFINFNTTYLFANLNETIDMFQKFYERNVINSAILNNITDLNGTISALYPRAIDVQNSTQNNATYGRLNSNNTWTGFNLFNYLVSVLTNITPVTNNTSDFGNSTHRFATGWFNKIDALNISTQRLTLGLNKTISLGSSSCIFNDGQYINIMASGCPI